MIAEQIPALVPLYEYELELTGVTDFGVRLEDVLAGNAPIPPSGLRVDIAFVGQMRGRLSGRIEGVDYLLVRPDGRMQLDIHATVLTPDGSRIAIEAGGVGLPEPGTTASKLRYHAQLSTLAPEYAWVNALEIWAVGEADVASGRVAIRGFLPEA